MLKIIFSFVLIFASSLAQARTVHYVISHHSDSVQNVISLIQSKSHLSSESITTTIIYSDEFISSQVADDDLVVTIGDESALSVSSQSLTASVLFSFVTDETHHFIESKQLTFPWQTVFLHPSPNDILSFAVEVIELSFKKRLLVAVSESNQDLIKVLSDLTRTHSNLNIVLIPDGANAAKEIEPYLFSTGLLIALPDKRIWSGQSAKWLLQQAFNYKIPVIGYSQQFISAGALASVYLSVDDITDEIAAKINNWSSDQIEKKTIITRAKVSVDNNPKVARVHNLNLDDLDRVGQGLN